jgi:TusA-related sulfurtransferase
MKKVISILIPMFLVTTAAPRLGAQAPTSQNQPCPMHASHIGSDAHHAIVESHGDHSMGFPHDKTTHHFRLAESGGSIEVTTNDPKDSANIEAIRMHLAHITKAFGEGDYSAPMLVHDVIPPGVTTMQLLKEKIHFEYHAVDSGGRVTIAADDPVARAAIHDFLRFQITDHETGDPLDLNAGK